MPKSEAGSSRPSLDACLRLMRLHRPIGILLLLWPVLWALWVAAGGLPSLSVLAVFIAGTVLMRSAGCVINDYADRNFDGHVQRTRERPLATGELSPRFALQLFAALVLAAGVLVLTQNLLTIALACVALPLAAVYPFMKRHTYLPQVWLGAAFAWAVPMSFAAQTGSVPPLAWLMLSAVVLWVLIYDTEYAMVDREDDLRIGIKSTAILFADADRAVIALLQGLMLLDLVLIGAQARLGLWYHLSLVAVVGLFVWQQVLIRERAPAACFAAFMQNNRVGAVIFAGIAADYALR